MILGRGPPHPRILDSAVRFLAPLDPTHEVEGTITDLDLAIDFSSHPSSHTRDPVGSYCVPAHDRYHADTTPSVSHPFPDVSPTPSVYVSKRKGWHPRWMTGTAALPTGVVTITPEGLRDSNRYFSSNRAHTPPSSSLPLCSHSDHAPSTVADEDEFETGILCNGQFVPDPG